MQWPNNSGTRTPQGEILKTSNLNLNLAKDKDGVHRLQMPKIQAKSVGLHTDPRAVGLIYATRSKRAEERKMIGQAMGATTQVRANDAETKKRFASETSADLSSASKQQKTVARPLGLDLNVAPDEQ